MAKKATKKEQTHDHAGHNHAGHSHEGHDHAHEGHDHEGHDHAHDGHDHTHEGHDHEGHNHEMPHTKVAPHKPNTTGIAEDGNIVRVHYEGTLDNGETFDSSREREPIEFALGSHAVIRGFENAVVGMKVGDRKKVVIEAEQAYGDINPELRQEVPRQALGEITPEVGMMLALNHPMAPQPIPVKIIAVSDENITIDLNHPLAGERLHFEIELVELK